MLSHKLRFFVFAWMGVFVVVYGRGRMVDPPGRSSMWRFGFGTPVNFDDDRLNCGHRYQPLDFLSGNCGLCGDRLDQGPKENEAGGKFATGIISKIYHRAEIITIKLQITHIREGFFEFRLCENNDVTKRITRKCLKHVLVNPDTGETMYPVAATTEYIDVSAQLPANDKLSLLNDKLSLLNDQLSLQNDKLSLLNDKLFLLNDQLSLLNDKLSLLNDKLSLLNDKPSLLNDQLSLLNDKLSLLNEQLSLLNDHLSPLNDKLSLLKDKLSLLNDKLPLLNDQLSLLHDKLSLLNDNPF
ncbi:hypothetical protein KP79_PYT04811 [Mizuhopecten yessoensis]|uniref:Uncharacterized protein n=1 Tax=Mizuhopecten yessoensis TaxID=6573 RepID=A0A210QC81_MIZYE|nr:hypothetical protein KP79_PYT04811 [Mizuhopecten yessoensis]